MTKRLLCITLFTLLFGSIFSQKLSAQTTSANLLDKVDLTFYLEGEPSLEEVGFNKPKSAWKVEYQLYLSDWDALEKIGRCGVREAATSKEYCSHTTNKKLDKRIKKISTLLSKGKYTRKELAADSNREIPTTVNLPPPAIEEFNQAAKINDKNPVFIFFVKSGISTRNQAGKKFKEKYMTEGTHYLKFYKEDKTFDYWNVSKLHFTLKIVKQTDGSLKIHGGYTHFG